MKKNRPSSIDNDVAVHEMVATNQYGTFFGVSQDVLDQAWKTLTNPDGNSVTYISMEIGAERDVFHPVKARLQELEVTDSIDPQLDGFIKKFIHGPEKIPNYSGGLGVLAGDTLKSFADSKIPALAITLLYRKGYFSQLVDSQLGQIAWTSQWEPEETPSLYLLRNPLDPKKPLQIEVPFYDNNDRQIMAYAQVWLKMEINNNLDFFVPQVLLDYSVEASPDWIRNAAQHLYDSTSESTKAIQRRLLGAGIVPVMQSLGITSKTIHLNEQHGVVVVLHLIAEQLRKTLGDEYNFIATDADIFKAAEVVAQRIVYTIHTPVKAGHDRFRKDIYAGISHPFCQRVLHLLAEDREHPTLYNFTLLAMRVNRATNSVSRLHKEVTRKQFPQYLDKITAITNGVHHLTWISDAKAKLYDSFAELRNWRTDPSVFANAEKLRGNNKFRSYLEQAWLEDSKHLSTYVDEMLVRHRNQMQETWIDPPNYLSYLDEKERFLDPAALTIGFARRFSTYKRADLIFDNLDTLTEIILEAGRPVNFIFAGKAHPEDVPGRNLIKSILDYQKELYLRSKGLAKVVFIPGYDMQIAKMMVAGVHAWLNSPKRPLEASGTSGMKAALNGIPNISIMDGWWVEGYHDGQTGWKFGYEGPVDGDAL
ncbi:MAG: alpha-glucan family phosphorylase, partial [Desulfobulbaceae bacterium]|nr:alpha-glucan family phosphorylase [Desulfobulbaceae bacterium]